MKQKIKLLIKKFLVPKALLPGWLEEVYSKMSPSVFRQEVNGMGLWYKDIYSLKMQSAPGTAEIILRLLQKESKDKLVLDFGSGEHASVYIKNLGFNVHSADIENYGDENFTLIDPKSKVLPFYAKQFHVVIASEVVEHVEDPFGLIERLGAIALDYVIVSTPNPQSFRSRLKFLTSGYLKWFEPKDFEYHRTPVFYWQVENFCKRRGWKIAEVYGNHEVYIGNSNLRLLWAETLIYKLVPSA